MRKSIVASLVLVLLSLSAAEALAQLAPAYRLTDLGNLGGDTGYAQEISNTGYITGNSEQADHRPAIFRYFGTGPMQHVGIIDGFGASGRAVNDHGTIVGVSTFTPTGDFDNGPIAPVRARLGEALQSLGLPPGFANGEALGVNNNEAVVGRVEDANFDNSRPFVFTDDDGYQLLGTLGGAFGTANDISESGIVVGFSEVAGGGIRGFRVTPDALGNYPTLDPSLHLLPTLAGFSNALDISANGQFLAGSSRAVDQLVHGFIYDEVDGMRDLGLLPTSNWSLALGVNSYGVAVGYGDLTDGNGNYTETVGWAWSEEQGIVQLDNLLTPQFAGSWRIEFADAINDSGWIVGSGYNLLTGTQHALLLTPVPEPSSFVLAGLTVVGAALLVCKRHASKRQA